MKLESFISPGLQNKQFFLLCLSSVLFMASFNMIIPELPRYLSSMGGEEYKGFIISLFAITAGISRPFSGKLADLVGRKSVMVFGALASAICGALYPFATGILAFLTLRLFHGLSTGFKPTGTTAYLADTVSDKNRGEAMGLLGMSGSIGMAAGPAIGSAVAINFGLNIMFALSSLTAFLSIATISWMKESLDNTQKFRLKMLKVDAGDIWERRVLSPSLVMLLTTYSFGMALTLIPDLSDHLGFKNRGLFFTIMLVFSVATRLFSGKASDRLGREKMLNLGTLCLVIAMVLIAFASKPWIFILGGIIFGIATGINSPTIFAWTVDLANPEKRGRAMATMYIALEIGILTGAFFSAEIYANRHSNFVYSFLSGALLALAAFVFLIVRSKRKIRNHL